jgi:hypothetical protein
MTPKAQVLLGMDQDAILSLVASRAHADRDPSDAVIVRHLANMANNRDIDPRRWAEYIDRRFPGMPLSVYVGAQRRVHLERTRWAAVRALIGTRAAPITLTPETAERLVELLRSWESSTAVPGATPHLDYLPQSVGILQPHPVRLAPDEGTQP